MSREIASTFALDPEQLKRIESVHRGFLYQHLYAVACLFKVSEFENGKIVIEHDEDIEVETEDELTYVQIKFRSRSIVNSDIADVLARFDGLRSRHVERNPRLSCRFVIVLSRELGPKLQGDYQGASWPEDVVLLTPGMRRLGDCLLPPAWSSLAEAVQWCITAADKVPFKNLLPETLVWKLAARVQFAATGDDPERDGHEFRCDSLPSLFEQLVEQLQDFPVVPADFRPQRNEPRLLTGSAVRILSGFSGAGKTVWASWHARHSSAATAYFDVGDLPYKAVASSLARELAARFLRPGLSGAATLPALVGIDLLRALSARLDLAESPLVVLDNVHRIAPLDLKNIIEACPSVRFILLAQPWSSQSHLEALFNVHSEELDGWSEDAIAAVFEERGARISPKSASRWRSITAGMPAFVKNAASLTVAIASGDADRFADQVEKGEHPKELAQETLLRLTIESLSCSEITVVEALALATVPLSTKEIQQLLAGLPQSIDNIPSILRSLERMGVTQVLGSGYQKIHDAMRLPIADRSRKLSDEDVLALQIRLRDALLASMGGEQSLARFGAWLRLLPPTGQIETLVDIATQEFFHEVGEPQDLWQILAYVAEAEDTDPILRFWAMDALAFWSYQDSTPRRRFSNNYLNGMADLVATKSLTDREEASLAMKKMIKAGLEQERKAVDREFEKAQSLAKGQSELSRIVRYNYAVALYHCGAIRDAQALTEALYMEYYELLGLCPQQVVYAKEPQWRAKISEGTQDIDGKLKHLADSLSLAAMCLRVSGQQPRLTAIYACKFYSASKSFRSAMRTAQDVADDFVAVEDFEGARLTMEEHVLPLLSSFGFSSFSLDARGQYSVILAYCGEIQRAREEMAALQPFISDAPSQHQHGIAAQRRIIDEISSASGQGNRIEPKVRVVPKPGRNARCPCGSGKKNKKCCQFK